MKRDTLIFDLAGPGFICSFVHLFVYSFIRLFVSSFLRFVKIEAKKTWLGASFWAVYGNNCYAI